MSPAQAVPKNTTCRSTVEEAMTARPVSIRPEAGIGNAWIVMCERRIRHLPVVDVKNRFVGLLTQRDLLAMDVTSGAAQDTSVGAIMRRDVTTVALEMCLGAAASFMLRSKKGCLPIVDRTGVLVGILTEADFLRWFIRDKRACGCDPVRSS